MNYSGRCHCGAIQFKFNAEPITEGLRCNCTICLKKGALMSNFFIAPDDLHIQAEPELVSTYQFASHVAEHFFCAKCGIYPFHKTKRQPGFYRVNLGCVDGIDSLSLPVVLADGAAF